MNGTPCPACLDGTKSDCCTPSKPIAATLGGLALLGVSRVADRSDPDMAVVAQLSKGVGAFLLVWNWGAYLKAKWDMEKAQEQATARTLEGIGLYGALDGDGAKKQARGAGALGLGLMGGALGAAIGSQISTPKLPLVWPLGLAGFFLPVIAFAPKKEQTA